MRQQLPAPTYLRVEVVYRSREPGGLSVAFVARREKSRGEESCARGGTRCCEISGTQNRRGRPGRGRGRGILRILESIHYSAKKTAASARRKIEPPCVRHPFYGSFTEWSMADCACFISLVRIFSHDSLASLLFLSPARSCRPTVGFRRVGTDLRSSIP